MTLAFIRPTLCIYQNEPSIQVSCCPISVKDVCLVTDSELCRKCLFVRLPLCPKLFQLPQMCPNFPNSNSVHPAASVVYLLVFINRIWLNCQSNLMLQAFFSLFFLQTLEEVIYQSVLQCAFKTCCSCFHMSDVWYFSIPYSFIHAKTIKNTLMGHIAPCDFITKNIHSLF